MRSSLLLPLLLLVLLAAATGPAAGQQSGSSAAVNTTAGPPVPPSEYLRLVGRAQEQLSDGLSHSEAAALTREFRQMGPVTLPDSPPVAARKETLLRLLGAAAGKPAVAKEAKNAITHLRALAAAVSPEGIRGGDRSAFLAPEAGAQAARILADKEFRRYDAPRYKKTWWDRVWESIGRGIEKFLRWLFGSSSFSPSRFDGLGDILLYTLYFIVGVAALVGLYFLGRMLYERYGGRTPRRRGESITGLDLADEIADPLSEAHSLAASGDLRGAVRFAYIAALRRLRDTGFLVLEKNRTNWEYQRSLRSRSREAYDTLLPATRLFDFVWYGRRSASPEEFESVIRIYEALPSAPAPSPRSGGGKDNNRNGASPSRSTDAASSAAGAANGAGKAAPAKPAAVEPETPRQQNPDRGDSSPRRKDNPW